MVSAAAAYLKGKAALARANAIAAGQKRIRIAAPQGGCLPQNSQLSNGTTQTSGTDRIFYQLNTDYAWLAAVLVNGSPLSGSGALITPGNGVTFRMSLEQGGTSPPAVMAFPCPTLGAVSSGGKTGHIIGDGEILVSAPTYKSSLLKGSYQVIRFYKTVSAGQKWPVTWGYGNYAIINGPVVPSGSAGTSDQVLGTTVKDGSDLTYNGNATFGAYAGGSTFWAPAFIIGEQITPIATFLIAGDSVSAGFPSKLGQGYLGMALEQAGFTLCFLPCGVPASTTANLMNNPIAKKAADHVDYILFHTISNDFATGAITTLDQAKAAILGLCQTYARAHLKMVFATCLPRPATTDAGATYAGQTKPTWEPLRLSFNNWMRDPGPNGARAYLNANLKVSSVLAIMDPCIQVERNADGSAITLDGNGQQAAGNGGLFVIGHSTDTTHPDQTLQAAMGASVPIKLFTLPVV